MLEQGFTPQVSFADFKRNIIEVEVPKLKAAYPKRGLYGVFVSSENSPTGKHEAMIFRTVGIEDMSRLQSSDDNLVGTQQMASQTMVYGDKSLVYDDDLYLSCILPKINESHIKKVVCEVENF